MNTPEWADKEARDILPTIVGWQLTQMNLDILHRDIAKALLATEKRGAKRMRDAAEQKARDRASLWRSYGGCPMGGSSSHLTVEGECDVIADLLAALPLEEK